MDNICDDLNQDGTCNYAKEKFNKTLHCDSVNCSRKYANEYKQKYENLVNKIQNISVSQKFLKSELNHTNINVRRVVEEEVYSKLVNELKRHYIEFEEIEEGDNIRFVVSIKAIKNKHKN